MHSRTNTRRLRRDLYGIVVLEAVQRTIAIGTLVAIAVYAAVVSADPLTSVVIASFAILALLHLAQAFRLRAGGDLLRRDLAVAEVRPDPIDEGTAFAASWQGGGPYRSPPAAPRVVAQPRRLSWGVVVGDALVTAALTGGAIAALR